MRGFAEETNLGNRERDRPFVPKLLVSSVPVA